MNKKEYSKKSTSWLTGQVKWLNNRIHELGNEQYPSYRKLAVEFIKDLNTINDVLSERKVKHTIPDATYYCRKCNIRHRRSSKIGKAHGKFGR